MSRVVVFDNGGGTIKAGWGGDAAPSVVVPNVAARIKRQQRLLLADETETNVKDMTLLQFMRPIERGYITDTFTQGAIWERVLGPKMLGIDLKAAGIAASGRSSVVSPRDCSMLLTTQPFMPHAIERSVDELVFETLGFGALRRTISPALALAQLKRSATHASSASSVSSPECSVPIVTSGTGILVDSGFSCTHVIPFFNGRVVTDAIKRVDIGGKFVTNYLKELISYRQWNMMHDTILVNQVKEKLSFISLFYDVDLEVSKRLTMPAVLKAATINPLLTGKSGSWPIFSVNGVRCGGDTKSKALTYPQNDGVGIGFRREYVLPDYLHVSHGFVKGMEDDPNVRLAAELAAAPPQSASAPLQPTPATTVAEAEEKKAEAQAKREAAPIAGSKRSREQAAAKRKKQKEKQKKEEKQATKGKAKGKAPSAKKGRKGSDDDDDSDGDSDTDTGTMTESSESSDSESDEERNDGDYEGKGPDAARDKADARTSSSGVSGLIADAEKSGSAYNEAELQVLVMNSERFAAPELLFRPRLAGLEEGGVHEAIAESISLCPADIRDTLWSSIVLTGGNARMPGFEARIGKELRSLAPMHSVVQLYTPNDPHLTAWQGGSWWATQPTFHRSCITKAQYTEYGPDACSRAFSSYESPGFLHT